MKPRRTRALQGFALVLTKGREDCMAGSIQQKLQRVGLGEFAKRLFKRKEQAVQGAEFSAYACLR